MAPGATPARRQGHVAGKKNRAPPDRLERAKACLSGRGRPIVDGGGARSKTWTRVGGNYHGSGTVEP